MRTKLTENEKQKIVNQIVDKLEDDSFKKVNIAAQTVLNKAPNLKKGDIIGILDWIEEYLLALKNT